MNSCNFVGRLTRDPELRFTPGGSAVCDFSIAINTVYYNKDGEKVEKVTYVNFVCWEKIAEKVAEYYSKSKWIAVSNSEMVTDTWDDKTTGEKRSSTKFKLREFPGFVGNKTDASEVVEDDVKPAAAKSTKSAKPATGKPGRPPKATPPTEEFNTEEDEDDPVPF